MSNRRPLYVSSIGKKWIIAITGLVMVIFVIGHLVGNLQFFAGPEVINQYGTSLRHMPFGALWVIRAVLLVAFVTHIVFTVLLVKENRAAKGKAYAVRASAQAKLATRLMALSGILLLSYVVFHLGQFTTHNVSPDYATWKSGPDHDVYRMLVDAFSHVTVSVGYIIAMVLLALHLSHGTASIFQTLGVRTRKMACCLGACSQVFAWAICIGYSSIPAAVLLGKYDKQHMQKVEGGVPGKVAVEG